MEPIEVLRARILNYPYSYQRIADEAGLERHGSSYVRKFAAGEIADLTTARFFALMAAMDRLEKPAEWR